MLQPGIQETLSRYDDCTYFGPELAAQCSHVIFSRHSGIQLDAQNSENIKKELDFYGMRKTQCERVKSLLVSLEEKSHK